MADVQTYRDPAAAGPVPTPGGPLSYIHWGPRLPARSSRPQRHSC